MFIFLIIFCVSSMPSATAQGLTTSQKEKVALRKAQKLRKRLLKGRDFATLVRKFSDDPGSAPTGGELGWVAWGQFVPAFEAAVAQLKPGELSEPVRTAFGYHVIQLIDRNDEQFNARHILIKIPSELP